MKAIFRRLGRLEEQLAPPSARPVHRIIFEGDPVPTDLPPGSTVHRIVFRGPDQENNTANTVQPPTPDRNKTHDSVSYRARERW